MKNKTNPMRAFKQPYFKTINPFRLSPIILIDPLFYYLYLPTVLSMDLGNIPHKSKKYNKTS